MPQSGSEPWFEPKLFGTGRKSGSKFGLRAEPNLWFGPRFGSKSVSPNVRTDVNNRLGDRRPYSMTALTMSECAVRADGTLKEGSEINWFNDIDDDKPISELAANPIPSALSTCIQFLLVVVLLQPLWLVPPVLLMSHIRQPGC